MFDLQTLTIVHTLISLAALGTGLPLLFAFAAGQQKPALASATIALLLATSLSGFLFPFVKFLPSHAFGVLSLILLAATVWARRRRRLTGGWLTVYTATLSIAIYLDAFVGVVQAFLKIPGLHALAPTQQSPGFIIAQTLLLVGFVALGLAAVRGLRRPASGNLVAMA
jgi:hypothetical protein